MTPRNRPSESIGMTALLANVRACLVRNRKGLASARWSSNTVALPYVHGYVRVELALRARPPEHKAAAAAAAAVAAAIAVRTYARTHIRTGLSLCSLPGLPIIHACVRTYVRTHTRTHVRTWHPRILVGASWKPGLASGLFYLYVVSLPCGDAYE